MIAFLLAALALAISGRVHRRFFERSPKESARTTPLALKGESQASHPRSRSIEKIRLGDRVLGRNPLREQVDEDQAEPEPGTWRAVRLRLDQGRGKTLDISLLRPLAWIEANGAAERTSIPLALPEMGAVGEAEVVAIDPCPPIAAGVGHVVTGTFSHVADGGLVALGVDGGDGPIVGTTTHPVWSEDRGSFVAMGELHVGERVRTLTGPTAVVSLEPRPGGERVYNIEVQGEHVYQVSTAGVLVHNECTQSQAFQMAKDRAGIPTSQQPTRQWTIRGNRDVYPSGANVRTPNATHHGRVYEFEVRAPGNVKEYRYIIAHETDPNHGGLGHVHVGQSKVGARSQLNPGDRYLNMDDTFLGGNPIPFR